MMRKRRRVAEDAVEEERGEGALVREAVGVLCGTVLPCVCVCR